MIPLVITFKNATLYQDEVPVLQNFDFELAQAEMAYLVGKSGSGKSTFLKALYAAHPVSGDQTFVNGNDLQALTRKSIPMHRRKMGMVFQDFHLFEKWTVLQNLEYVLKATDWKDPTERNKKCIKVIQELNLSSKTNEPIYQLSGGEKQRVVIARALLNDPPLLICDEPTGNLDPQSSEDIMRTLFKVATTHKTAILIATHDFHIVDKFPARVFKCEDQTIREI